MHDLLYVGMTIAFFRADARLRSRMRALGTRERPERRTRDERRKRDRGRRVARPLGLSGVHPCPSGAVLA